MIKFKFWDSIDKRFCDDRDLYVDNNGAVYQDWDEGLLRSPNFNAVASTGLTDNDKNEIYYGDVYHVAGYGTLVINSINDIVTLMEAKAESDLGDKLGDIYNNPELAGEE